MQFTYFLVDTPTPFVAVAHFPYVKPIDNETINTTSTLTFVQALKFRNISACKINCTDQSLKKIGV